MTKVKQLRDEKNQLRGDENSLREEELLLLQRQLQQGRPQQGPDVQVSLAGMDVSCCKLSSDFLAKHGALDSYAKAAQDCDTNEDVKDLLTQLGTDDKSYTDFSCIIAPSGTGKPQLAATAAQTNEWNVVYFYTGSGEADGIQEFYKPHVALRDTLFQALVNFSSCLPHDRSPYTISVCFSRRHENDYL